MTMNSAREPVPPQPASGLKPRLVYQICGGALVLGLALGYFVVGVRKAPAAARASVPGMAAKSGILPAGHPPLTMEQMKAMADMKAAPLLEQLKRDPKNVKLLEQAAALYGSAHQFKDAENYYTKSLQIDPKNTGTRTELASVLYYQGDVDGALRELQNSLKYSPNDVNALFNLGMIKFKGKDDAVGAIAAWQQLLKAHPDLDRKATVEKMIAEANQKIAGKK
jgi:cytochrome c-type biogenesis protein CcmH/NrfG